MRALARGDLPTDDERGRGDTLPKNKVAHSEGLDLLLQTLGDAVRTEHPTRAAEL